MRLEMPHAPAPPHEPADISAWLATLKKVLRMPEARAAGVLDELEDHLRQRVRDLQLSGHGDAESVRLALNELGDAAMLARRLRLASGYSRRRLAMNLAVIGVACGAAVLSTVAISRGGGEQAAATGSLKIENAYIAYQDGQPGTRLSMTDGGEATLQDVLDKIAKQMQLPLHVRWDRLDQRDVHKDSQVVIVGRDLEVPEVFKRINEGEAFQHATLDFRADHGVLEIADREFFDRRERTLATYDVSAVLDGRTSEDRQKVMEEVAKTITQFASPEDWRENGGELGVLTAVDGKLFVEAPPRMHRQVKWILDQLKGEAQQKPKADAGGRVDVRRFPLAHTSASEVLRTLQGLDGIKEIDFSRFTVDARTNSILCMGDQAVEDRVKGALAVLDRPAPKVETLDTFGNPVAPAQKP